MMKGNLPCEGGLSSDDRWQGWESQAHGTENLCLAVHCALSQAGSFRPRSLNSSTHQVSAVKDTGGRGWEDLCGSKSTSRNATLGSQSLPLGAPV